MRQLYARVKGQPACAVRPTVRFFSATGNVQLVSWTNDDDDRVGVIIRISGASTNVRLSPDSDKLGELGEVHFPRSGRLQRLLERLK